MKRRRYLGGMAAGLTVGAAGCTGSVWSDDDGSDQRTYLPEPELEYGGDLDESPYPRWGDPLPEVTLPAPLHGEEVTTTAFDRDVFVTFFYSHCETVCPRLISTLRNIQTRAVEEGHGDDVVFLAVTFDPERDTADRLREYADVMSVDLEAGNWYFLRPESTERAEAVVSEEFGVAYDRMTPEDADEYMFVHFALTVLANAGGHVERGYSDKEPAWQDLYEDFETLREREG